MKPAYYQFFKSHSFRFNSFHYSSTIFPIWKKWLRCYSKPLRFSSDDNLYSQYQIFYDSTIKKQSLLVVLVHVSCAIDHIPDTGNMVNGCHLFYSVQQPSGSKMSIRSKQSHSRRNKNYLTPALPQSPNRIP